MRVLLACTVLAAAAQASSYRFGATQDRVVSDEPHGYTQHITPDFEVQDGLAVTYVRLGRARVARLISSDYAAKVYTDVAPLDAADGKITAGDAWISQQAGSGALSLPVTPTAVERLLLSGARRILYESVPTTVYFAHDQLGSLTVETDDQGAVLGRRAFSTFGMERASTGDSDSYGFTGQRRDDSGTVHFSFRQLDPTTGRWSSTDPLFHVANADKLDAFGEATTSYAYVANNPSNHVDPSGLAGFWDYVLHPIDSINELFGSNSTQEAPSSAGEPDALDIMKQFNPGAEEAVHINRGSESNLVGLGADLIASAMQLQRSATELESPLHRFGSDIHVTNRVQAHVREDAGLRLQAGAHAGSGAFEFHKQFGGYAKGGVNFRNANEVRQIAAASHRLGQRFIGLSQKVEASKRKAVNEAKEMIRDAKK